MFNNLFCSSLPSTGESGTSFGLHCPNFPKSMHEGVIRDAERQRIKRERILELEEQHRLQEAYEKVQPVGKRPRDGNP